jgi:hypothetical protein
MGEKPYIERWCEPVPMVFNTSGMCYFFAPNTSHRPIFMCTLSQTAQLLAYSSIFSAEIHTSLIFMWILSLNARLWLSSCGFAAKCTASLIFLQILRAGARFRHVDGDSESRWTVFDHIAGDSQPGMHSLGHVDVDSQPQCTASPIFTLARQVGANATSCLLRTYSSQWLIHLNELFVPMIDTS